MVLSQSESTHHCEERGRYEGTEVDSSSLRLGSVNLKVPELVEGPKSKDLKNIKKALHTECFFCIFSLLLFFENKNLHLFILSPQAYCLEKNYCIIQYDISYKSTRFICIIKKISFILYKVQTSYKLTNQNFMLKKFRFFSLIYLCFKHQTE